MVTKILTDSKLLFMGQSSLVDISLSKDDHLNVCGDIHGQFYDLANIFDLFGFPTSENQYLFNGDFVDRGVWSVEVTLLLFSFKLLLPGRVHILIVLQLLKQIRVSKIWSMNTG